MRRVIGQRVIGSGKWLKLLEVSFETEKGIHQWEMAERTTKKSESDGVDIIAILEKNDGSKDKIVLVSQFRPPLNAICLEFPAGLITEQGETFESAAFRELQEETGYHAYSCEVVNDVLYLDPGLSNASMNYCVLRIDSSDERNLSPIPDLQDEECIQVHLFDLNSSLYSEISKFCAENRTVLDARLASFAFGLSFK